SYLGSPRTLPGEWSLGTRRPRRLGRLLLPGPPLGGFLGLAPGFVKLDDAAQGPSYFPGRDVRRGLHRLITADQQRFGLLVTAQYNEALAQEAFGNGGPPIPLRASLLQDFPALAEEWLRFLGAALLGEHAPQAHLG